MYGLNGFRGSKQSPPNVAIHCSSQFSTMGKKLFAYITCTYNGTNPTTLLCENSADKAIHVCFSERNIKPTIHSLSHQQRRLTTKTAFRIPSLLYTSSISSFALLPIHQHCTFFTTFPCFFCISLFDICWTDPTSHSRLNET